MHGFPFSTPPTDKLNYFYIAACYFRFDDLTSKLKALIEQQDPNSANDLAKWSGMANFARALPAPTGMEKDTLISAVDELPSLKNSQMADE